MASDCKRTSWKNQCASYSENAQTSLRVVFIGTMSLLVSSPNKNSSHFQQKVVPMKTLLSGLQTILSNWLLLSFENVVFQSCVHRKRNTVPLCCIWAVTEVSVLNISSVSKKNLAKWSAWGDVRRVRWESVFLIDLHEPTLGAIPVHSEKKYD